MTKDERDKKMIISSRAFKRGLSMHVSFNRVVQYRYNIHIEDIARTHTQKKQKDKKILFFFI